MTSSLYRDLQAGRGTEVEQILGDLIGRARALGVATPLLDLTTLALRVHQQRVHNSSPPHQPIPYIYSKLITDQSYLVAIQCP